MKNCNFFGCTLCVHVHNSECVGHLRGALCGSQMLHSFVKTICKSVSGFLYYRPEIMTLWQNIFSVCTNIRNRYENKKNIPVRLKIFEGQCRTIGAYRISVSRHMFDLVLGKFVYRPIWFICIYQYTYLGVCVSICMKKMKKAYVRCVQ